MKKMPVTLAGQILDESDPRMWRMLLAHVNATHARLSFENMVGVGAMEMNRRKEQNYLTLFGNPVAKRVLFFTLEKDSSVCGAYASELLRHNDNPKAIQHVTIEMRASYTTGVSDNLGNALLVDDKFHVIENVAAACDHTRKVEGLADAGKRDRLELTH